MKFGLAYFRPDDQGGENQDVENANQDAQDKPSEHLLMFLKKNNIELDTDDQKQLAIAMTLWRQSGKNAREAEAQRKRAQEAERKASNINLDAVLANMDDESKQRYGALVGEVDASKRLKEALALLADANVTLTQEMIDLANAGPEATKAFLSVHKPDNAQQDNTTSADIFREQLAQLLGLAADQQQHKQDTQQTPNDPLARYRSKDNPTARQLAAMKEAALKNQTRSR